MGAFLLIMTWGGRFHLIKEHNRKGFRSTSRAHRLYFRIGTGIIFITHFGLREVTLGNATGSLQFKSLDPVRVGSLTNFTVPAVSTAGMLEFCLSSLVASALARGNRITQMIRDLRY